MTCVPSLPTSRGPVAGAYESSRALCGHVRACHPAIAAPAIRSISANGMSATPAESEVTDTGDVTQWVGTHPDVVTDRTNPHAGLAEESPKEAPIESAARVDLRTGFTAARAGSRRLVRGRRRRRASRAPPWARPRYRRRPRRAARA